MQQAKKHYLVTGGLGFIGSHLCERLLIEGHRVSVIDNLDPFYDLAIKYSNRDILSSFSNFSFILADIRDANSLREIKGDFTHIVHLAAKAGVLPSLIHPLEYIQVNVLGTYNMLEFAKERGVRKFIYASSSSVYGNNINLPWKESDTGLLPISVYATTKISGEQLGYTYAHVYGIQFLALRFFAVYGPRQRPDLAMHKFIKKILKNDVIQLFGDGSTSRDYTYVEDIVGAITAALGYNTSVFDVFNLGNNKSVTLLEMITAIENLIGKKARIQHIPLQSGDVQHTLANIDKAKSLLGYKPETLLIKGIESFYKWYQGIAEY